MKTVDSGGPVGFEGYFAWLDILGFKDILRRNPSFGRNQKILLWAVDQAVCHGKTLKTQTPDGDGLVPDLTGKQVRAFVMSDTVVFLTEDTSPRSLRDILIGVWWFMPNGYAAIDEDLALRGAVTKGHISLLCGSSPTIDHIMMFEGPAVIEAVELESRLGAGVCVLADSVAADLAGLSLDVGIKNRPGVFYPVLEWGIPFKGDGEIVVENTYVVNWPLSPVDISGLSNKFNRMEARAAAGWPSAQAKNTREFYESVRAGREPNYSPPE